MALNMSRRFPASSFLEALYELYFRCSYSGYLRFLPRFLTKSAGTGRILIHKFGFGVTIVQSKSMYTFNYSLSPFVCPCSPSSSSESGPNADTLDPVRVICIIMDILTSFSQLRPCNVNPQQWISLTQSTSLATSARRVQLPEHNSANWQPVQLYLDSISVKHHTVYSGPFIVRP